MEKKVNEDYVDFKGDFLLAGSPEQSSSSSYSENQLETPELLDSGVWKISPHNILLGIHLILRQSGKYESEEALHQVGISLFPLVAQSLQQSLLVGMCKDLFLDEIWVALRLLGIPLEDETVNRKSSLERELYYSRQHAEVEVKSHLLQKIFSFLLFGKTKGGDSDKAQFRLESERQL